MLIALKKPKCHHRAMGKGHENAGAVSRGAARWGLPVVEDTLGSEKHRNVPAFPGQNFTTKEDFTGSHHASNHYYRSPG